MQKTTAIIPTFNEEENIERALKSVQWADEIIVVDSFSTDQTVSIAEKWAHKVVQHEYVNSAAQKNWIIPQAQHEWVFILDADEVVSPELQKEIRQVLERGTEFSAFSIGRDNYFMDMPATHSWSSDRVTRLFRRDENRYQELHVHAEIESKGKVGSLKGKIIHHTYKSFHNYFYKFSRYAIWSARDYYKKTEKVTYYHLAFKPFYRFFRHFLLKRGFMDGKVGFIIASISAYGVFLRYLIVWRMKKGEKIHDL